MIYFIVVLKMIRFGGKNLLLSAPKQASDAFAVESPRVLILLIFLLFMGDLWLLQNLPAKAGNCINEYRFGQVIECDKFLIFN